MLKIRSTWMTLCILVDVTDESDLPHDFIFKIKD
jgi:hypothetical protein